MANPANNQPSLQLLRPCPLDGELLEFAIDRQARNLAPKRKGYQQSLDVFRTFCVAEGVTTLADVTASHLQRFLVHLRAGPQPGRRQEYLWRRQGPAQRVCRRGRLQTGFV